MCWSLLSETLNCLGEMNEARVAAGLPKFGEATKVGQILPEHSPSGKDVAASTLWDQICKKIMGVSSATSALLSLVLVHLANQQTTANAVTCAIFGISFVLLCEGYWRNN